MGTSGLEFVLKILRVKAPVHQYMKRCDQRKKKVENRKAFIVPENMPKYIFFRSTYVIVSPGYISSYFYYAKVFVLQDVNLLPYNYKV